MRIDRHPLVLWALARWHGPSRRYLAGVAANRAFVAEWVSRDEH